jgi:NAD(P)-dependent dehydrogenase (short-subunit alcohol dehydrogenase family)
MADAAEGHARDRRADRFRGRVAVVTGGGSGIGLAAVDCFVREGARVVVGDVDAAALADASSRFGDDVAVVQCDVTVESDVERLVATAIDRFDRLDIAFANAGIGACSLIVDMDQSEWRRVIDVSLSGAFLTIKHAAGRMIDGGAIVVTASLNAVQPGRGLSAYCAAKAGAAMLAQVAAMELGPAGIRVNAVAPGLVRTPLTEGMWLLPSIVDEFAENTPLRRHAGPSEIADFVAFLASDDAAFVTGSLHLVDGGAATMRYPDIPARATDALLPQQGDEHLE